MTIARIDTKGCAGFLDRWWLFCTKEQLRSNGVLDVAVYRFSPR
jgi:hypothetical protein